MRIISFPSFTMRVLVRQLRYFTQMKRSFNSTKTKVKWQVRNKCNNVMVILYRKISLSLSLFIIIILPCTHFISHPSHFIENSRPPLLEEHNDDDGPVISNKTKSLIDHESKEVELDYSNNSKDIESATTVTTATPVDACGDNVKKTCCCSNQDLIELVRAVKFARPDSSIRNVHREIVDEMSKNEGYEFLRDVTLNNVKKIWKKAIMGSSSSSFPLPSSPQCDQLSSATGNASSLSPTAATTNTGRGEDKSSSPSSDGIDVKLYTVGDGSVRTLAENYTLEAASRAVAEGERSKEQETKRRAEQFKGYVHCFLDVPADSSGRRPHQALINFNDNSGLVGSKVAASAATPGTATVATSTGRKKNGNKKRGGGSSVRKKSQKGSLSPGIGGDGEKNCGRIIVKIQVAAGSENNPMLLYNADRSAKTFIHPPTEKTNNETEGVDSVGEKEGERETDDGGYVRILNLIVKNGIGGALGCGGGTKGYFYAIITRRKSVELQDIVSIDGSCLAPMQSW